MRGTSNTHISTNRNTSGFSITGEDVRCYGDVKNLFRSSSTLNTYALAYLFYNCTALTKAPDIDLTAFTLSNYCCRAMFQGCTSLTTAPKVSATTLAEYCYMGMFYDCTSLITTPVLSVTTLARGCYQNMFRNCTSLTSISALPATTLASYCYFYMFNGCSKIKLSKTQTDEYTQTYRIPTSGTGTGTSDTLSGMFGNTGGTFTGTPTINTTYYVSNTNTIA